MENPLDRRARPSITVLEDPRAVARDAAERVTTVATDVLRTADAFRLVLSGGSTPAALYEMLAGGEARDRIAWTRVHFFWGDERCVAPNDPASNYRMARKALLDPLKIPASNIHRIRGEAAEPDAAARDYESEIREHFGLGPSDPPPSFDLILLGMGADGHTAALFPKTPAMEERTRWVVPNRAPAPPEARLTLTPVLINRARWVVFLVTGSDKAKALKEVLEGPADPVRLPAQGIRPENGPLEWICDKAAASYLRRLTTERGP